MVGLSPLSISVLISELNSLMYVLISIFANSDINLELLHTTFPSVSKIIRGNGEFIRLVFAAESTVIVKSCKVSDISLFLFLFV